MGPRQRPGRRYSGAIVNGQTPGPDGNLHSGRARLRGFLRALSPTAVLGRHRMKMVKSAALSLLTAITFVFALALTAAPAQAQATRTWVSGVGDDVNPCSRTAPCKTFAGAISKTAAGGEINCLDPGGYGTVTITKSITIDCSGTFGSILNSGGINGFVINDSLAVS